MSVRIVRVAATVLLALVIVHSPASAQEQAAATVRVTRNTSVWEQPRGDSIRVGSVTPGMVLQVLATRDRWYLVSPSTSDANTGKTGWERGWIHAASTELVSGTLPDPPQVRGARPPVVRGPMRIHAFAQTGGTLFSANDSFDTILGSPFGPVLGGGGQVVFPNAAYVQVSFERFRETGTRALVSGTNVFTVNTPATVEVRPILGTVGYRSPAYRRFAPYFGAGLGWHVLTEEAPGTDAERTRKGKIGYHVVGGSELTLARFLALAGEVQWATVPKAMGETGVSAVFGEDNLGGTTFRFKVILGY